MFGADSLPPIYRLDEDHEEEEEAANRVATEMFGDEAQTEQVPSMMQAWGDWSAEPFVAPPSQEDAAFDDDSLEDIFPPGLFSDLFTLPPRADSPASVTAATLDPTSPTFIPSDIDNLRPLPPGPEAGAAHMERLLRGLEESYSTQEHISASPPQAPSTSQQLDLPPAGLNDEAAAHDTDPLFMTDGRGRVVWSSTSSTGFRGRGRGRATSSSATILPHSKSSIDLTATEEGTDDQSQEDVEAPSSSSTPRRLVRRRSVPLLGSDTDAEFVTDGRGRVVFASHDR